MNTPDSRLSHLGLALLAVLFLCPASASAQAPFSNQTLQREAHPRPIATSQEEIESDTIPLESGKTLRVFRQEIHGVGLWRFEFDNAYWWVSSRGVIWGRGTHAFGEPEAVLEAANDEEAYERYVSML